MIYNIDLSDLKGAIIFYLAVRGAYLVTSRTAIILAGMVFRSLHYGTLCKKRKKGSSENRGLGNLTRVIIKE